MKKAQEAITNDFPEKRQPDVEMAFKGLLMFRFDDAKNTCEVGILPDANHYLRITIEKNATRAGRTFKKWEKCWEFPDGINSDLAIKVNKPDPRYARILRYQHNELSDLDRNKLSMEINSITTIDELSPIGEKIGRDYRWVMHLGWFHGQESIFKESVFHPQIKLTTGLFFSILGDQKFREFRLTHHNAKKEFPSPLNSKIRNAGIQYTKDVNGNIKKTTLDLKYIAISVGVNIYLAADDAASVQLRLKGKRFPSLKRSANCYYKVTFNNDCREDKTRCIEEVKKRGYKHSDLPLYYDYYDTDRLSLKKGDFLDIRTDQVAMEYPCIPISGP